MSTAEAAAKLAQAKAEFEKAEQAMHLAKAEHLLAFRTALAALCNEFRLGLFAEYGQGCSVEELRDGSTYDESSLPL